MGDLTRGRARGRTGLCPDRDRQTIGIGPMRSMTGGWGRDGRITVDMVLGATVFGVVGAAIGYYWGTTASLVIASAVGVAFGFLIGLLGGRRFFVSIVCGALLGGGLAWFIAGMGAVPLGAASGGAMGGFLGVQLGMLMELRKQSRESHANEPSPSEGENPR